MKAADYDPWNTVPCINGSVFNKNMPSVQPPVVPQAPASSDGTAPREGKDDAAYTKKRRTE